MKRKLRPGIRTALSIIAIALGIFLASIEDFSLSALPMILLIIGIEIADIKILDTF